MGLEGNDRAYLWLFNDEAAWYRILAEGRSPQRVEGGVVKVTGLADGKYRVVWWDTRF